MPNRFEQTKSKNLSHCHVPFNFSVNDCAVQMAVLIDSITQSGAHVQHRNTYSCRTHNLPFLNAKFMAIRTTQDQPHMQQSARTAKHAPCCKQQLLALHKTGVLCFSSRLLISSHTAQLHNDNMTNGCESSPHHSQGVLGNVTFYGVRHLF